MKISALIEIPRNKYPKNIRYANPMRESGKSVTPGV